MSAIGAAITVAVAGKAVTKVAEELFLAFVTELKSSGNLQVASGQFGADMKVSLLNDGPVTIIIDSKEKK